MHTPEQAAALWCPMARVAQIGIAETGATYNRALIKMHVPIELKVGEVDELIEDQKPIHATILKVENQLSGAAMCLANKCAMWRWADGADGLGYCGLAPLHQVAA